MVSQDVILFDDTVKNNIAYAKTEATDEEIVKACKFAAAVCACVSKADIGATKSLPVN